MKAALITPIPEMSKLVADTDNIHMILPSVLEENPGGTAYASFYRMQWRRGGYVIVDNGAYKSDGGESRTMGNLLGLIHETVGKVSEIVLPDTMFLKDDTYLRSLRALAAIENSSSSLWAKVGEPNLMIVPHGRHLGTWTESLRELIQIVDDYGYGPATIGVSKIYGGEILDRLHILYSFLEAKGLVDRHPVHLLGWAGTWGTLLEARRSFPLVRSVDSARPITYGLNDKYLDVSGSHPPRSEGYFHLAVPPEKRQLVEANVQMFKDLAGGLYL